MSANTINYETILRAVGRVLDMNEARSFTLTEVEDGLSLDMLKGETAQHQQMQFSLAELSRLIDWVNGDVEALQPAEGAATDQGLLREFLERHTVEPVGSSR